MPVPSQHSLAQQQTSTRPTTPMASAISVMKRSPSLMHHSQQTPSTHSTATPQAPSTQTPSTHSLVPQQISTRPTTPMASATSAMKTSPSPMHSSQQTLSTHSTATPQAPSTQAPSTHSLVPQQTSTPLTRLLVSPNLAMKIFPSSAAQSRPAFSTTWMTTPQAEFLHSLSTI